MNQKFVQYLEEGFASELHKGNKVYIKKTGSTKHTYTTLEMAKAVAKKIGYDGEIKKVDGMFTFTESLDEGRGRPKLSDEEKDKRQQEKQDKPKGKRGRPKKETDDSDDSGKEGTRTVTLTAKIKIGGEKKEETKELKDTNVEDIDKEIDKWEKALNKKYDYEADITISKKIGDYDVDDDATNFMTKNSDDGDEEDEYEIGRKDK